MMVSMVLLMSVLLLQVTGRISDVMASMVVHAGAAAARRRTDLRRDGQHGRGDVDAPAHGTGRISDLKVSMVVLMLVLRCVSPDGSPT